MLIYVIIFVLLLVGIFILISMENTTPNVFVAFADELETHNESDYYSGLIVMDENVLFDEFKVMVKGYGLESAGVINGQFYLFKELKCGNDKKLDYISIGNIVLLDFPERRLRQIFEVVGIEEDDGLLTLAWYNDDEEKKKVFNYYTKAVIGIMQ